MNLVRSVITRAEALGYHSLWVLGRTSPTFNNLEAVSLLTYAAALTSRVRLGTSVLVFPLYNPVQLAHSLQALDILSVGRTIVGLGLGGPKGYELHGVPVEGRVRRFMEGLAVMKALWTQPRVTHEGAAFRVKDFPMEPKPVQKPHPPVWFGGNHPAALQRAVRHADGWMGAGSSSTAHFRERAQQVRQYLDAAGRDPAGFVISKRVYIAVDEDRPRAERRLREAFGLQYGRPELADETAVWGSPEQCAEQLAEVLECGAELVLLNPMYDELEQMERLSAEVLPRV